MGLEVPKSNAQESSRVLLPDSTLIAAPQDLDDIGSEEKLKSGLNLAVAEVFRAVKEFCNGIGSESAMTLLETLQEGKDGVPVFLKLLSVDSAVELSSTYSQQLEKLMRYLALVEEAGDLSLPVQLSVRTVAGELIDVCDQIVSEVVLPDMVAIGMGTRQDQVSRLAGALRVLHAELLNSPPERVTTFDQATRPVDCLQSAMYSFDVLRLSGGTFSQWSGQLRRDMDNLSYAISQQGEFPFTAADRITIAELTEEIQDGISRTLRMLERKPFQVLSNRPVNGAKTLLFQ